MKLKIIMTLILVAILSLTGCKIAKEESTEENIPDVLLKKSDMESSLVTYGVAGLITDITKNEDNTGSIFVEGDLETNGAVYDKAYVSVSLDTIINMNEEGGFLDLEVGQYVLVFFDGPVMESYPVQGTAKQINVIDEPMVIEEVSESE